MVLLIKLSKVLILKDFKEKKKSLLASFIIEMEELLAWSNGDI